jgi:hypothetical protein
MVKCRIGGGKFWGWVLRKDFGVKENEVVRNKGCGLSIFLKAKYAI